MNIMLNGSQDFRTYSMRLSQNYFGHTLFVFQVPG